MKGTLLTVNEAAQRLKCHPQTVRRWIGSGRLGAVKVGDLVRVPEPELAKVVAPANRAQTQPKTQPTRKHKPRGAAGLIALMEKWRKQPSLIAAAREMEQHIKDAKQPVDWSDPFA